MKGQTAYAARLKRLREAISDSGLDGIMMVPGPNIRYLTNVNSLLLERPFLLFVPADGEIQLVAPALEAGPYRNCPLGMSIHVWTDSVGPAGAIAAAVKSLAAKRRWGVEGRVPFQFLSIFSRHSSADLRDAETVLQGLREIKDAEEVSLLDKSTKILSKSFEEIPQLIREGMTELELARKLQDLIYANGATLVSELLVQSGARAANPHSLASSKRIRREETIVLDLVSSFEGYHADITRTFCLGDSSQIERIYGEVLEAQSRAIAAAGEGVPTGDVDAAARSHLARAGLGVYFIHRTGHGLGLEVHEAPYIVENGKQKLRRNMFFTVEPGVYLPGKLGVRIEDNVRIAGAKGIEITDPPKEYGWWR